MPLGENINKEQREDLLKKALKRAEKLYTGGEKHLCAAVQQKPLLNLMPHVIIVTNKRVLKHEPKILRAIFIDYLWKDLVDVHLSDHVFGSKLIFQFEDDKEIVVDSLPKEQAKKIYCIAQEKEEEWVEKRRLRDIEEQRAKSGASHIIVGKQSSDSELQNVVRSKIKEKLLELKGLLDEGLITQDEYHNKKSQVLNEL